jgi:hypothetical protein
MPPKPIPVPPDKTQAEANAAARAAKTVPTAATGVFWVRRAMRMSARAMATRISSGMSKLKSDTDRFHSWRNPRSQELGHRRTKIGEDTFRVKAETQGK